MFESIVGYIKSFFASNRTLYSDSNTYCTISSNGKLDVAFDNAWVWDAQQYERKFELNIYDQQYVELQCFRSVVKKFKWYLDDVLIDVILAFLPTKPADIGFGKNSLPENKACLYDLSVDRNCRSAKRDSCTHRMESVFDI